MSDGAPGPADCEWCPVCQAMARLRVSRPDLADQLTATSAALTSAVTALLHDLLPPEPDTGPDRDSPVPPPSRPAPERIEIEIE